MKMRIDLERFLQFTASLFSLSQCFGNHSCMKEEKRVSRSEPHGFLACFCRLIQLAIFKKNPRQGIPCIDIVANLQLFLCEIESLGELHVMIGVKERQIAIVQHLIDMSEQPNVFNKSVLLLGLCRISR